MKTSLSNRFYVVNRRYKQFVQLHRQCAHSAQFPLAQFPKKVSNPLSKPVVEGRAAMLEIYLQVAVLDVALWPVLREFLGVPESTALQTENSVVTAPLSSGELLIASLQSRLLRDPSNKVSSLVAFSLKFFSKPHQVSRKHATCLINLLIPLCEDQTCGSLALDIVAKLVSPASTRCSQVFLSVLTKLKEGDLATMRLDGHILGKFPGDSISQAFGLISLLSAHLLMTEALLNSNYEAMEVFDRWQRGEMESKEEPPREEVWRLSNSREMQDMVIEYKAGKGLLEINVVLEDIIASPSRIADCIAVPTNRLHWDSFVKGARTLQTVSPTISIIELLYEDSGRVIPIAFHCTIDNLRSSEIIITYRLWSPPDIIGPYVVSYHIEQSPLRFSFCSSTASHISLAGGSTASPATPIPLTQTLSECSLSYKARFTGDLMRIRLEDFANGRSAFTGVWKALKQYAETEQSQGPADLRTDLAVAVSNKILAPRGAALLVKRAGLL